MAVESGEGPKARELRIHGVGGSHGAKMLGCDSPHDVVVVGEGLGGTAVLARRADRSVESYDWGDLTSGTGSKPFWVFLLPFTLLNLAGWMHPPFDRVPIGRILWIRRVVHLLSALLTAVYVFSLAIILVDHAGFQWSRRVAAPSDPERYPLPPPDSIQGAQVVGVVLGLLALAAVVGATLHIARSTRQRFEDQGNSSMHDAGLDGNELWEPEETLRSAGFFFHKREGMRRLRVHQGVAIGSWALVALWVGLRMALDDGAPPQRLEVGTLLSGVSAGAYLGVLALWALSLGVRREPGERWARSGPAIAATLSFGLVNAVVSGVILLLVKQLNQWPNRPDGAPVLQGGPEVNLVDVWGGLVLALAAVAIVVGLVVVFRPWASTDDIGPDRERKSGPGCAIDGLDPSMRKSLARARLYSILAKRGGSVAWRLAAVLYATGLIAVVWRLIAARAWRLPAPMDSANSALYRVGAYVLPALALLLVQVVRKGRTGARTFASTLWDVFTFWPRRFSPLAVRPYSERAVPELQGRILHLVRDARPPCPVLVSAHSQGTILAFAALSSLPDPHAQRVALVTYGSPITSIYGMFFPAYFGPAAVDGLRAKLPQLGPDLLGWRNFYRLTDPIGGPVFGPGPSGPLSGDPGIAGPPPDVELPDPYPGPARDRPGAEPPLERDPVPWLRIAGHSYYGQEPALKDWVASVRAELAAQPPA